MRGEASGVTRRANVRDAVTSPCAAFVSLQRDVQLLRRVVGTCTGKVDSHGLADQRIAAIERGQSFGASMTSTIDRHRIGV